MIKVIEGDLNLPHGDQGKTYLIPVRDEITQAMLTLPEINEQVFIFLNHANQNPKTGFQITRIGCYPGGYKNEQIAAMFQHANRTNCFFDVQWRPYLGNKYEYWGTYPD